MRLVSTKKYILRWHLVAVSLIGLAFLLSSCELNAPSEAEATAPEPQALFTAAAQTAEAMRLQRFGKTPSPEVQTLIETAAGPQPSATLPAAGPAPATPTSGATAPAATAPAGNQAEFVADINIPDGTVFAPGQAFTKTWRISNTGQTTWTTDYALIFIDGDLMGAESVIPMTEEVAPGKTIDVSVDMVAPETAGTYTSFWEIKDASGKIFGFGSTGDASIWVKITVQAGGTALDATAPTTSAVSEAAVQVNLSADNPTVSGACPHTFIFTARLTLAKAATVTYALEAGDIAGSQLRVPSPATKNLEAGPHLVVYELTLAQSIAGWARLRLTGPAEIVSNQVSFTLTCV